MRRFYLRHDLLESAEKIGYKVVAQGVEFNDTLVDAEGRSGTGKVVVDWLVEPRSIVIWDSIDDLLTTVARDGRTTVSWMD